MRFVWPDFATRPGDGQSNPLWPCEFATDLKPIAEFPARLR
jgi:hypothetical protein